MGFATHLGPWLLGTVKNTTGATSGTIRNLGATVVSQSKAILYTDITAATVAFTIPAGSQILTAQFNTTVAYATTTPTYALFANAVALNTAPNGKTVLKVLFIPAELLLGQLTSGIRLQPLRPSLLTLAQRQL